MANFAHDPWSDVRLAIRQRDVRAFMKLMFDARGQLNNGFRVENELWDYKRDCPRLGKEHLNAWADLAKEVLGLHNGGGGVLIFGITDSYHFAGAGNRLDGKQLNDGIRRFLPDRIWVDFHREFINEDQTFLGIAMVPPRGALLERFILDAPEVNGRKLFLKHGSAIRRKDSFNVLDPGEVDYLVKTSPEPVVGRQYQIDEPFFRILAPDYTSFVFRKTLCQQVDDALLDNRVAVVSLVGIGGIGKTALATWAVTKAYERKAFQFIVSITAKDRELTASGIRGMRPGLTSFEALLNHILDVVGFPEVKAVPMADKEDQVLHLLKGSNGLIFVDNLETVDDTRVLQFLDSLPEGVKAVVTSRRTKVRNLVRPVDVGGLDDDETIKYVDTLEHYPGLEFAKRLTASERLSVGDSCDRIPLALRWILSRSQSATEAMANAAKLREGGRSGDELLEYSFRRVFDGMSSQERRVLQVLCLFQRPLASEALVLGSTLSQGEVDTAVDCLVEDALVQRQFDPDTNDYMFFLRPIPSAFVQAQMAKHPGVADGIRRRLTDWYEAKDILDNERRLMVRELRQGRGSPELVLLDLAKASLRQGDYDAAEKQFEQSLARVPTSWRAAHEFAEFKRHSRHDRTGALKLYERAAAHSPRRGPDRARIFREFGLLLRDSGEPNATDQAIEKFEVALKETPNDPVAIYGLAQMLELKGHYDRMIELLEPLKAHPNPVTRERCLPKLLKAYEQRSELLKAAELRDILRNSA